MKEKIIFRIFLDFSQFFLKKLRKYSAAYSAKFCYWIRFFGNFPHLVGALGGVENCKTIQKLHQVACGSDCIFFFLKPGF